MRKIWKKHMGLFLFSLLAAMLCGLLNTLFALVLKRIIDIATLGDVRAMIHTIFFALCFIFIFLSISYMARILQFKFSQRVTIDMREALFKSAVVENYSHFDDQRANGIYSKMTADTQVIETEYVGTIYDMVISLTTVLAASVVLINISLKMSLWIVLAIGLPVVLPMFFRQKLTRERNLYSDHMALFTKNVQELLKGLPIISHLAKPQYGYEKFQTYQETLENRRFSLMHLLTAMNVLSGAGGVLMLLTTFLAGGFLVMQKELTVGSLLACVQLLNNIVMPLTELSVNFSRMSSVKEVLKEVENQMALSKDWDSELNRRPKPFHRLKRLELFDVHLQLGEREIIHDATFTLEKGNKYALVGASGSGKTVLGKIIAGQLTPSSGHMALNGMEVTENNHGQLQATVLRLDQDPYIFDFSMEENITLGRTVDSYKIKYLTELLQMEKVRDRERLGVEGSLLSGGEKQRTALMRGLYESPEVLIIDEGTSALDCEMEKVVESLILNDPNLTVLWITHRLNAENRPYFDAVLTLEKGQLLSQSTPSIERTFLLS